MAVLVVVLSVLALTAMAQEQLDMFDTAGIAASYGYPSETHHVTTSDGYILEVHRMQGRGQTLANNRPVVFMMHGLTAASNSYIMLGPNYAPAYNLADAGFDVWLGNARGNKNSRFHTTLDPDHSQEKLEFFDFSFEEIAIIDLPAMIDYALAYTGQEKLHYIGHSQGGTVFLVLGSLRPEYIQKITSVHLLAGVGYQNFFPHVELAALARLTDIIYNMAVAMGFVEVAPSTVQEVIEGQQIEEIASYRQCTGNPSTAYMCELIGLRHLLREEPVPSDSNIFDDYESAGAALKQIAHYGQNIRDKSFCRWSYGTIQNLLIYGTRNPPKYDVSLITVNVTMHYTVNDALLDERDVLAMANDMPNTIVRKVARDTFLHEDFVAATDSKVLVTDYIIEALKQVSVMPEDTEDNNNENVPVEGADLVIVDNNSNSAHNLILSNIMYLYLIGLSVIVFLR